MENKADGVCAVIVTYGNRFHLLKQVIDGCLRNNVKKIIIVDNASEKASKDQLMKMLLELKDKLKVISLEENLGSAGGYKKGLEYAYSCPECEFIWLLDDDNVPEDEALKTLLHFYQNLTYPNKEYKVALASFRESHKHYKEAIMKNKPDLVLGKKNSFLGFYIFELPQKLLLKFLKVLFGIKLPIKEDPSKKSGQILVAPYGGLFFNKKLLTRIGYPDENFFVYSDDYEWTYRIPRSGGRLFLILDSVIKDIETSWYLKYPHLFKAFSSVLDFVIYYYVRNRVYFEKTYLVDNYFLYRLNMAVFLIISRLFLNNHKYSLLKMAINDGLNGNLVRKLHG